MQTQRTHGIADEENDGENVIDDFDPEKVDAVLAMEKKLFTKKKDDEKVAARATTNDEKDDKIYCI